MSNEPTLEPEADAPAPGVLVVNGAQFMADSQGRLVPLAMVKPMDMLIDQLVRRMMDHALELSARIGRFKGHCFDDVGALEALIAEQYQAKIGGKKGNISLTTFDGCLKVTVQVQDQITFGPELQAAKSLVDECIGDWADGARGEIRMLVEHAFQVDKEGRINRGALFALRRIAIADERWKRAMEAIGDSIRVVGSKTYIRFHRREKPGAPALLVTLDMAAA